MEETNIVSKTNTPLVYHVHLVGKELICNDKIIVSKYDNNSIKLIFHDVDDFRCHYVAYKLMGAPHYKISPLCIEDNSPKTYAWVIDSTVTHKSGIYEFVLICSDTETEDGIFVPEEENNSITFISKPKKLEVDRNFLDADVDLGAVDVNIKLLYNDVMVLRDNLQNTITDLTNQINHLMVVENSLNTSVATALNIANNAYDEVAGARVSERYGATFESLAQRLNNEESIYVLTEEYNTDLKETEQVVSVDWGRVINYSPSLSSNKEADLYELVIDGNKSNLLEKVYINLNTYADLRLDLLGAVIGINTKCYLEFEFEPLNEGRTLELSFGKIKESSDKWAFEVKDVIQVFNIAPNKNNYEVDITYFIKNYVQQYPNEKNNLSLFVIPIDEIESNIVITKVALKIISEN